MYSKCLAPGHWRACEACTEAQLLTRSADDVQPDKVCAECERPRGSMYFLEGASVCTACQQKERFKRVRCRLCPEGHFPFQSECMAEPEADTWVCFKCAPEELHFKCTVCKVTRGAFAFPPRERSRCAMTIRRCTACYTCRTCHETCKDARGMVVPVFVGQGWI